MAAKKVTNKSGGSKGLPKVPTSAAKVGAAINSPQTRTKGKATKKANQVGGPS